MIIPSATITAVLQRTTMQRFTSASTTTGSTLRHRLLGSVVATATNNPTFGTTTQQQQQQPTNVRSFSSVGSSSSSKFDLPDYTKSTATSLTKIVATIGPTSEQEVPLRTVVNAGMNIMRLNFSHATTDEVELRVSNLQKAVTTLYNNEQVVGVLLDTKGPEIRTGKLQNDTSGHDTILLQQGHTITLQTDPKYIDIGSTVTDLFIDFQHLSQIVREGSTILLDDGAVILTVTATSNTTHGTVSCTIENTATLRSRAGVNIPYADTSKYSLPALSDKDKKDIFYGMTTDVNIDFVAASFVQTGQGVRDIRNYIEQCAQQLGYTANQPRPLIISKIETGTALQNFDDILTESDSIMVARGDLGVEIPLQQVTNAQKEMIAYCNAAGKPVIVATQMLESMTKNPRPTRAEVADVTNAVYDGADAVMTSGETAKGKYPAETIRFMQTILVSTEQFLATTTHIPLVTKTASNPLLSLLRTDDIPNTPSAVVAAAAVTAANKTPNCQAIIVLNAQAPMNNVDNIATLVAAYRPLQVPIYAVCATPKIARQLTLYRAIRPILVSQTTTTFNASTAIQRAKELYNLQSGAPIIVIDAAAASSSTVGSTSTTTVPATSLLQIDIVP